MLPILTIFLAVQYTLKMRKLILFATVLFLSMTTLLTFSHTVFGKEVAPSPSVVKYDLAYPGILPDHLLYKIKVLRDKISAQLISDPLKKLDFYLLQTDKGILASAMLVDKGKIDLAIETALKAEHNYTLLTQGLYRLSSLQQEAFFKKLKTASQKHQEVLLSLAERVDKDKKEKFIIVANFSKRNWETIEEFKAQEVR